MIIIGTLGAIPHTPPKKKWTALKKSVPGQKFHLSITKDHTAWIDIYVMLIHCDNLGPWRELDLCEGQQQLKNRQLCLHIVVNRK